jgi:hypothetical protein
MSGCLQYLRALRLPVLRRAPLRLSHTFCDAREVAFFPKCFVWIHRSNPFLPRSHRVLQPLAQIVGVHDGQKLDFRIDPHEQRFDNGGNVRRIAHVEKIIAVRTPSSATKYAASASAWPPRLQEFSAMNSLIVRLPTSVGIMIFSIIR